MAQMFSSYNSLVDLLLVKGLLGGFWMVQVKQKPAEMNQNEELHTGENEWLLIASFKIFNFHRR